MPVSSPSYFPPNTSTDQITGINAGHLATGAPRFLAGQNAGANSTVANLIIIGHLAGDAGITDAVLAQTTIIGHGSAGALTSSTGNSNPGGDALTIVGSNCLSNCVKADSSVIMGQGILPLYTGNAAFSGLQESVLIGNGILAASVLTGASIQKNVFIGHQICAGITTFAINSSVIIGQGACVNGTCGNSVIIGANAAQTPQQNAGSNSVLIGVQADQGATGGANVVIGGNANSIGTSADSNNVVLGNQAAGFGSNSVVIGKSAKAPSNASGLRSVIIGDHAGRTIGVTATNIFCIETNDTADVQRGMLYGSFLTGNLVIGNSTDAANRDLGGSTSTNILKLLNGTVGNANPVGGGYFYVSAGILHWVDSSGVDTTLSSPAAPTTGASTASFLATNKPGATTGAGPVAWENRVIAGVSYQSPLWAT